MSCTSVLYDSRCCVQSVQNISEPEMRHRENEEAIMELAKGEYEEGGEWG
jgi:hypothetical protein